MAAWGRRSMRYFKFCSFLEPMLLCCCSTPKLGVSKAFFGKLASVVNVYKLGPRHVGQSSNRHVVCVASRMMVWMLWRHPLKMPANTGNARRAVSALTPCPALLLPGFSAQKLCRKSRPPLRLQACTWRLQSRRAPYQRRRFTSLCRQTLVFTVAV